MQKYPTVSEKIQVSFGILFSNLRVVFRTKRHGNITTGTRLTGASNAGGVDRNRNSEPISGFTACCQRCDRPRVINTPLPDHAPASCDTSKRWSFLMAGDDDEVFMTRSLNVTPNTTEQRI